MTRQFSGALSAAALVGALGCTSQLTGNEGNFVFSYVADDEITNFNKPIAVGAWLDIEVRDVGARQPVELSDAGFDDTAVLSVDSFSGHEVVVHGEGDGTALLSVEGTTTGGEDLSDSVNLLASTPEVLVLAHTCTTADEAAYMVDHDVVVPFELEMSNGQPVIGYGYYPVTIEGGPTVSADDSDQQFMAIQTGAAAGSATVISDLDDTTLAMTVVEAGDVDGVQEPIAFVLEDIDVGDTNAFFVRPMVGELIVCQSDIDKTVASLTPEVCDVREREPAGDSGEARNEGGWFEIEGLAEGDCDYTVSYADGASGAGVTEQFSFPIEP